MAGKLLFSRPLIGTACLNTATWREPYRSGQARSQLTS